MSETIETRVDEVNYRWLGELNLAFNRTWLDGKMQRSLMDDLCSDKPVLRFDGELDGELQARMAKVVEDTHERFRKDVWSG